MNERTPRETEAAARANLKALREAMNGYHRARMTTEAACQGVLKNRRGLPPALVAARVSELRDLETMKRAINELYSLLEVLNRRQPTEAELAAGPSGDEPLGNFALPTVPGGLQVVAGIGFGAWTLTSLFNYLREREIRIQQELGIGASPRSTVGLALAGVAGTAALGAGAYFGWKWWKGRKPSETATDEDDDDAEEIEAPFTPTIEMLDDADPLDMDDDEGDETEDDDDDPSTADAA